MKTIITYFPFFTVALIFFGFCNLHFYYESFGIEIYSFINTTDILLSFLPLIVSSTTFIYSFLVGTLIREVVDLYGETSPKNAKKTVEKRKTNLSKYFMFIILFELIHFLFLLYMQKGLGFKNYELQEFNAAIAIITIFMIYIFLRKHPHFFAEHNLLICLALLIYIGTQIGYYRRLDGARLKDVGYSSKRKISFKYQNYIVQTSDSVVYIGQTQKNIFLYNRNDSTTKIFLIDRADSLVIK